MLEYPIQNFTDIKSQFLHQNGWHVDYTLRGGKKMKEFE